MGQQPVVDMERALASYVARWRSIDEVTRRRVLREQAELRSNA
jgi:hypothetical protein